MINKILNFLGYTLSKTKKIEDKNKKLLEQKYNIDLLEEKVKKYAAQSYRNFDSVNEILENEATFKIIRDITALSNYNKYSLDYRSKTRGYVVEPENESDKIIERLNLQTIKYLKYEGVTSIEEYLDKWYFKHKK